MERSRIIVHKGVTIIVADLSNLSDIEESIAVVYKTMNLVATQAPKSVRLLTDVTGTPFNARGVEALKVYAKSNTPYLKASAVAGVAGIKKIVVDSIIRLTGRDIRSFATTEDALDWLAAQ